MIIAFSVRMELFHTYLRWLDTQMPMDSMGMYV